MNFPNRDNRANRPVEIWIFRSPYPPSTCQCHRVLVFVFARCWSSRPVLAFHLQQDTPVELKSRGVSLAMVSTIIRIAHLQNGLNLDAS